VDGQRLRHYAFSKLYDLYEKGDYAGFSELLMDMRRVFEERKPEEVLEDSLISPRVGVVYSDRLRRYLVPLYALSKLMGQKHYAGVYTVLGKTMWTKALDSFVYQPAISAKEDVLLLPSQWGEGRVGKEALGSGLLSVYFSVPGLFRVDFIMDSDSVTSYMKRIHRRFSKKKESKIGKLYSAAFSEPVVGYDHLDPESVRDGDVLFFLPLRWRVGSVKYYSKAYVRLSFDGEEIRFSENVPAYAVRIGFEDPFGLRKGTFVSPYSYVVYYSKKAGWL